MGERDSEALRERDTSVSKENDVITNAELIELVQLLRMERNKLRLDLTRERAISASLRQRLSNPWPLIETKAH